MPSPFSDIHILIAASHSAYVIFILIGVYLIYQYFAKCRDLFVKAFDCTVLSYLSKHTSVSSPAGLSEASHSLMETLSPFRVLRFGDTFINTTSRHFISWVSSQRDALEPWVAATANNPTYNVVVEWLSSRFNTLILWAAGAVNGPFFHSIMEGLPSFPLNTLLQFVAPANSDVNTNDSGATPQPPGRNSESADIV